VIAAVTFGCGGGSGTPATPAAGTLTRMANGDTFTFALKGSNKFPTGGFSYSGTAVLVATDNVALGSKTGLVKLTATTNMTMSGEPASSVSDTWYGYDATGNALEVANQDDGDSVFEQPNPFLFLPATYSIGQSGSYTKIIIDDTTSSVTWEVHNVTWEVHKKSVVSVPAGNFETFVVKVMDTESDGVVTKTEYYVAPQLGYPVKIELYITGLGGVSQKDEAVLKSYTQAVRG
jgi:hypothetical protein